MPVTDTLSVRHCLEQDFGTPRFRDENVLFFANLKSLFLGNTEQTRELIRLVGELNTYGGRLIPMLNLLYRGGGNSLVLEQEPDDSLMSYFSDDLALSLPDIHVMRLQDYGDPSDLIIAELKANLKSHPETIDGYVTDATLKRWAEILGLHNSCSEEGYRIGNNKTCLHQHLESQDLPIPDTIVANSVESVKQALNVLQKKGYKRAVVRAAIGASGIGMLHVDFAKSQTVEIPQNFFHAGPCLVQGWLQPGVMGVEEVTSPSVQFFIADSALELFDVTSQILSGDSVHEGNFSPPTAYDPKTLEHIMLQARNVGLWLHKEGYRGSGSVDFIVIETVDGGKQAFVCEVNARVTGATYPSVLARHFKPKGAWLMRNLRFENKVSGSEVVQMLDDANWLYRRGQQAGVIPINLNSHADGRVAKGQFLCIADDIENCSKQLDRVVEELPVRTSIERD